MGCTCVGHDVSEQQGNWNQSSTVAAQRVRGALWPSFVERVIYFVWLLALFSDVVLETMAL